MNRNLEQQPISQIMTKYNLTPHDIVAASSEQITHKMVARAAKGRRLTKHVQFKILRALKNATDSNYSLNDLFNY